MPGHRVVKDGQLGQMHPRLLQRMPCSVPADGDLEEAYPLRRGRREPWSGGRGAGDPTGGSAWDHTEGNKEAPQRPHKAWSRMRLTGDEAPTILWAAAGSSRTTSGLVRAWQSTMRHRPGLGLPGKDKGDVGKGPCWARHQAATTAASGR